MNIKSSSVGLVPLFKRNNDNPTKPEIGPKVTTSKITTLKISPTKTTAGAIRKAKSDLGEKVSGEMIYVKHYDIVYALISKISPEIFFYIYM